MIDDLNKRLLGNEVFVSLSYHCKMCVIPFEVDIGKLVPASSPPRESMVSSSSKWSGIAAAAPILMYGIMNENIKLGKDMKSTNEQIIKTCYGCIV